MSMGVDTTTAGPVSTKRELVESVVIRFAGDSGDGMQVTGSQFTQATALFGNDLATFPDFPAEIRAPAGTTYGVSAFQIHFGEFHIQTAGDAPDVLVAMNPAALKVNIGDLKVGGTVVVDTGTFKARNLAKAGYDKSPLEDHSLAQFQVVELDISRRTLEAVEKFDLTSKEALRCKNFWTLGLMLWMYGRDRAGTIEWLQEKFSKRPEIANANVAALNAGHAYGETTELSHLAAYNVPKAHVAPGLYRTVTGTEALGWGLLAGANAAHVEILFASYPITPASPLLHTLARLNAYGVTTFQAEDEIAAICAAIGASFAGTLGITSSSGPGIALKGEALGLAITTELPLIVVNTQRAGPSTGLPTKTEQSDLFQAVYGRNADAPLVVLASATPSDCFDTAIEAVRLATKFMTPVMILSDGYLANAAEPWLIPDAANIPDFPVRYRDDPQDFHPFVRDPETLARAWAKPGTPGLEHRIGGLEKDYDSGDVSYDPENHQRMMDTRAAKVAGIANHIPLQTVNVGPERGRLALVGWGSTFGAINQAIRRAHDEDIEVSHIHLRHLWPFPRNLGELLGGFEQVIVPEMNMGQLVKILRSEYLIPAEPLTKVTGKPFKVSEILETIRSKMES